ncbi:uncharacterized protein TRAVEDRAFT_74985 [Trametes versicolor FP-101664 SS1]|uniref:uncharacterized protein n=1 Tax=Trametes versicolor (strain FP-101664) TaxID=717944 RepID=UPI0004621A0D|nr:uncharacterized protein TRAVEDRAFT_74985 [Trametes versicolor FP-101664 SS1]EIW52614.1 hypothetical protein TRAVEDRAFT_74985 [Trametes versicolor FP-101664 SS1]
MAYELADDTVRLDGPLYGLLPPDYVGPIFHDTSVLGIGLQVQSSQSASSDVNLLKIRALWNARLPIHKLPPELLVDILSRQPTYARPGPVFTSNKADWFRLTLVCRRWRAVVKANPCFWRSINVGKDIRWLTTAMSRSGAARLHLNFSMTTAIISALPELLDRRHQIGHLRLSCFDALKLRMLEPLVCGPFPSLTQLEICVDTWGRMYNQGQEPPADRATFRFKPEDCPELTKLSLRDVSIPWSISLLAHLRSLDLRGCMAYSSTMSVAAFLDVLRCAQDLEDLTLHDLLPAVCSSRPGPSERLRAVTLPRLRQADLADNVTWISLFIGHLQLPSQGSICFSGFVDKKDLEDPFLTYRSMLPRDIDTFAFLHSTTSARLHITDGMYSITCKGAAGPTVILSLLARSFHVEWTQSVDAGVAHFVHLLRDAPLTELDLVFDLENLEMNVFDALLDTFPQVQELRLRSTTIEDADVFPQCLCESLGSHNPAQLEGAVRVRAPKLRALRIEQQGHSGGLFMDDLAWCVSTRAEEGAPRLELLAVTLRRSTAFDYREFDAHYGALLVPAVDTYEFVDKEW